MVGCSYGSGEVERSDRDVLTSEESHIFCEREYAISATTREFD